jgi:AraC-like DNA-binding protein
LKVDLPADVGDDAGFPAFPTAPLDAALSPVTCPPAPVPPAALFPLGATGQCGTIPPGCVRLLASATTLAVLAPAPLPLPAAIRSSNKRADAAVPSAINPARSFRASTSVRDYARDLGVTTSHLNESLRLETGLTAGELIRARLLLEAKRLLLHSELTMAGIGYELGFEDPSYFSRFIRRELKTSPAEFRSLIRQKYQKFMR